VDLTPLDPHELQKRGSGLGKGRVADESIACTVGVDTGKRFLHRCCGSWLAEGGGWFHDYDSHKVESDRLGVKPALLKALRELKALFDAGWRTPQGRVVAPQQVWIDAHYHEHTDAVYEFCKWANAELKCARGREIYRPTIGYGEGQRRNIRYAAPKHVTNDVAYVGNGYDLRRSQRAGGLVVHVDANHWKSELHHRLGLKPDSPQAILLYQSDKRGEHHEFASHLTAEKQIEEWTDKGPVVKWEFEGGKRPNHYLDAAYACTAAGHLCLAFAARPRPAKREKIETKTEETPFLASMR
jgi:hypothetical protein